MQRQDERRYRLDAGKGTVWKLYQVLRGVRGPWEPLEVEKLYKNQWRLDLSNWAQRQTEIAQGPKSLKAINRAESKLDRPVQELAALLFTPKAAYASLCSLEYDFTKLLPEDIGEDTVQQGWTNLKEIDDTFAKASIMNEDEWFTPMVHRKQQLSAMIPQYESPNRIPYWKAEEDYRKQFGLLSLLDGMIFVRKIREQNRAKTKEDYPLDSYMAALGVQDINPRKCRLSAHVRPN